MLPRSTSIMKSNNKTIYINPDFKGQLPGTSDSGVLPSTYVIPKNTHINPLFLDAPKIHMNPVFLQKLQKHHQQQEEITIKNVPENKKQSSTEFQGINVTTNSRKIICKSKNCLIREPLARNVSPPLKPTIPLSPLLVINKRKLIRKSSVPIAVNSVTENVSKPSNRSDSSKTRYRLDNRWIKKKSLLPPTPKIKRASFVGRYALRRSSLSLTPTITKKKSSLVSKSNNKKLQVLNINGLLYKSTRNSLKLKSTVVDHVNATQKASQNSLSGQKRPENTSSKPTNGLTIFVRGTKYVMDANKFKLTRVANSDQCATKPKANISAAPVCRRIDIGGYTYVSVNSAKNILIRTSNHLSRAYVHNAKHKSLQLLAKRLVKTNVPCPIFRRVGKCAAFERGKCSKAHNKLQVAICVKFLRGDCFDSNCLLSHNVSLSKMPVCKFFLQGVCVRNDCPYLHKKLSDKAEVCIDFLRGFCQLADKCNKRHEFVCPEIERSGICTTKNCIFCKGQRRKELQMEKISEKLHNKNINQVLHSATDAVDTIENSSSMRYFIEKCDSTDIIGNDEQAMTDDPDESVDSKEDFEENGDTNKRRIRPKIGTLPSYIPL